MTPRRFSALIGLFLLLLLAANLAIHRLTTGAPSRRIMALTAQKHPAANLAFLGNSLMAGGIRPEQLDATRGQPAGSSINAALGGSTALSHLLLERSLLENNPNIKTVVYGYRAFQLTNGRSVDWQKAIGNNNVILYREPELVRRHLDISNAEAAFFYAARSTPMFADRAGVWTRVEMLRRKLGSLGMPESKYNDFGRVNDFVEMEKETHRNFSVNALEHAKELEVNSGLVKDIITTARNNGGNIVFVLMPVTINHRKLYTTPEWNIYHEALISFFRVNRAGFIDASDWVPDDVFFNDPLHLGAGGAVLFTRKLAEVLEQQKESAF